MELTQESAVHMGMRVSPRLVAASYILELSSQELQQAIAQELSENPAMDIVEKETCPACGGPMQGSICPACLSQQKASPTLPENDYDGSDDYLNDLASLTAPATTEEDFDPFTQVASQVSLPDRLLNDLQSMLPGPDLPIAQYLVGNLNDNGYLQLTVDEVARQIDVPVESVQVVLTALQSLEPIGIGARDLRECLLIQLAYLESEGIVNPIAQKIVTSYLQELAEHKFSRIASELGVSIEAVQDASDFIRHRLNPYPAQGYGAPDANVAENRAIIILPDVIINQSERGAFDVEVIESKRFYLRITPLYQQLAANLDREPDRFSDDEKRHIKQYVSRAKLFIANINQRRQTLQKITEYIVEAQKEFLINGVRHLKPLTRAAVAYHLGMHESTVSRATAAKYVMLPNRKVIPFSDFFTASLSVMDVIKELIASETSPLTDQEIADELARRGIVIARRTAQLMEATAMRQWGGRFESEPDALLREFNQSIDVDQRLFQQDIRGSIAHVRMLGRQGIIAPEEARHIEAGLRSVADEAARGEIRLDHALEDVHTHVEARLRELIGPVAGKLHTARSRNDQVALDLRLYLRETVLDLLEGIGRVQGVLQRQAAAWGDVVAPGYTHLQRAQPVLLAHHLLAYHEMLARDAGRLQDAYSRINVLPLGSGALAGVPYPIDRAFVAAELGFAAVSRNSMDAVGDRDFVIEFLADSALAMAHLSRLAEEIVIWSSSEFGYLELSDSFTTGSSIMPQKKNPDLAELVRGKVGRVYGDLMNLLVTVKGLPLTYNKDLQEDKEALFDAADTLRDSLAVMAGMLDSARVNRERLASAATAGFSLATDVADYLVARGIPFREAHGLVGLVVQRCLATGYDLSTLPLEDYQAISPAFDEGVYRVSAETSVQARDVPGGTAPARVREALRLAVEQTAELFAAVKAERDRLNNT